MPKTTIRTQKQRRILNIVASALLISMGLMILIALQHLVRDRGYHTQAETLAVNFYFRDSDDHWSWEMRHIDLADNTAMVESVLNGLAEGPRTAGLLPSIPDGVHEIHAGLRTNTGELQITFPASFHEISPIERIVAIGSLVHTLTDLPFVDNIRFFVGDEPMLDSGGDLFGLRNRGNTTLEGRNPWEEETEVVVLYFPNEQMTGLVAEERTISINPLQLIEHFIVEALIEGPQTPGLFHGLPADAGLPRIERMDAVVIVDFAADFYDNLGSGSRGEEMMVFSLVNTLTERAGIRSVQIQIDGLAIQPYDQSASHMDLSRPIERDESLIVD